MAESVRTVRPREAEPQVGIGDLKKGVALVVGLLAVLPGGAALLAGFGAPPGQRLLFGIGLEVVAWGVLAGVMIMQRSILRMPRRRVVVASSTGAVATLVLLTGYYWSYDTVVQQHDWYPEPTAVVVPFRPMNWASPRLDSLVACVRPAGCAAVARPYGPEQVRDAITRFGPDEILPQIPGGAVRVTISSLFVLYSLLVGALVATCGVAALRLARDEQRVRTVRAGQR